MKILEILKDLKKTKVYNSLLRFFIIPIYSFLWEYILNFKEKIVGIIFNIKNLNIAYFNLDKNSKKLVKDCKEFNDIAKKINESLSDDFIKEKISYIKSEKYKKELFEKNKNEAMALNPFVYNLFDFLDYKIKKEIIEFAISEVMIKTAYKYLGVYPLLARIYVNLNIPRENDPRSSQLWHRDDFGYKNLDLFLAINEINENNGPLYVLKKKDPLNIFYRVKKEIGSNLRGERGKILDKDFQYLDSDKGDVIKLEGKPGTGLLIDSIRNYHKGGYCKLNYRLTLRINYMTSDSTFPMEKIESQRKSWHDALDDNKKNNFFTKQLFKNRNFLMKKINIPKFLFKFYHLISIKG